MSKNYVIKMWLDDNEFKRKKCVVILSNRSILTYYSNVIYKLNFLNFWDSYQELSTYYETTILLYEKLHKSIYCKSDNRFKKHSLKFKSSKWII